MHPEDIGVGGRLRDHEVGFRRPSALDQEAAREREFLRGEHMGADVGVVAVGIDETGCVGRGSAGLGAIHGAIVAAAGMGGGGMARRPP